MLFCKAGVVVAVQSPAYPDRSRRLAMISERGVAGKSAALPCRFETTPCDLAPPVRCSPRSRGFSEPTVGRSIDTGLKNFARRSGPLSLLGALTQAAPRFSDQHQPPAAKVLTARGTGGAFPATFCAKETAAAVGRWGRGRPGSSMNTHIPITSHSDRLSQGGFRQVAWDAGSRASASLPQGKATPALGCATLRSAAKLCL